MKFLEDAGTVAANGTELAAHPIVAGLINERVPAGIEGWTLPVEDQAKMVHLWPVGPVVVRDVSCAALISCFNQS